MTGKYCKICESTNLIFFAHTAQCGSCGVLLYWPYPSDLGLEDDAKSWTRENVLDWYSKSSFYNHSNFTNMLRFTMGESFKGRKLDILDYGGGGGQFALVCKSHFPESTVYISDISDDSLLEELRPINTQIPFKDFPSNLTKFDVIFLNDVFEHVREPLFVLKQLSERLKPGGLMLVHPQNLWVDFRVWRPEQLSC